jgi:hypothetical protein
LSRFDYMYGKIIELMNVCVIENLAQRDEALIDYFLSFDGEKYVEGNQIEEDALLSMFPGGRFIFDEALINPVSDVLKFLFCALGQLESASSVFSEYGIFTWVQVRRALTNWKENPERTLAKFRDFLKEESFLKGKNRKLQNLLEKRFMQSKLYRLDKYKKYLQKEIPLRRLKAEPIFKELVKAGILDENGNGKYLDTEYFLERSSFMYPYLYNFLKITLISDIKERDEALIDFFLSFDADILGEKRIFKLFVQSDFWFSDLIKEPMLEPLNFLVEAVGDLNEDGVGLNGQYIHSWFQLRRALERWKLSKERTTELFGEFLRKEHYVYEKHHKPSWRKYFSCKP